MLEFTGSPAKFASSPPVVVALSAPHETRWGHHQFPKLSWLPAEPGSPRRLLLTYNLSADDDLAYGVGGPALVSDDQGLTWRSFEAPAGSPQARLAISNSPLFTLPGGDALCVPFPPGRPPKELPAEALARPVGRFYCYAWRSLLKLDALPAAVRDYYAALDAVCWNAADKRWSLERIAWDTRDLLVRVAEGNAWCRTSFEQRPVALGSELIWADYKTAYLGADGSVPPNHEVYCMVSRDQGRSFHRRGTIAPARGPDDMQGEPEVEVTSKGELVCVIRQAHHAQRPMTITFSADAGRTWEPTAQLHAFGVLPRILRLGCGALVVSFGRPGVHLMVSPDGSGRRWTQPMAVIPQDATCGYTDLVPLSDDSFLLTYSDFRHRAPDGTPHKAIMAQRYRL